MGVFRPQQLANKSNVVVFVFREFKDTVLVQPFHHHPYPFLDSTPWVRIVGPVFMHFHVIYEHVETKIHSYILCFVCYK